MYQRRKRKTKRKGKGKGKAFQKRREEIYIFTPTSIYTYRDIEKFFASAQSTWWISALHGKPVLKPFASATELMVSQS